MANEDGSCDDDFGTVADEARLPRPVSVLKWIGHFHID